MKEKIKSWLERNWLKTALLFCLFSPSLVGAASAPTCTISISPSTIKQGESANQNFKIIGPVSKVIWRADGILSYMGSGLVEDYPEISSGRDGGYKIKPGKIGTGSETIEVYGPGGTNSCSATIKVVSKDEEILASITPEEQPKNINDNGKNIVSQAFSNISSYLEKYSFIIVSVLIVILVSFSGFLFRKKIKTFFRKIKSKKKTFLSYSKPSKRKNNLVVPRKKHVYVIVVIIVVLFIGAGTGLGFFIKDKFNKINQQLRIETAEKENAQKLAEENSAKMVKAQQEANQEKIAKNQKALELAQKEKTERELNADKDGDELTYRQEISYGTSDSNTDSDGDGIPDGQDMHPAGGGVNQVQTFAWSYGGHNWNWTESIPEDWYYYYKEKPRSSPESTIYITSGDPFIKKISNSISEGAEQYGLGKAWLAVAFVQSLPYVDDVYTGYDERPKYPVETFFEKNGDCEDTSYLTASILDAMNISSVLILLPGHMAVGVWMDCNTAGTYYTLNDKCYYYVETTGEDWPAGEIPDEYRYTNVTLVKIPSGEKIANIAPQYKKPCDPSPSFIGYYYSGDNYYSDAQCNYQTNCLPWSSYVSAGSLSGYYYNPQLKQTYHDSSCTQILVKGCYKSKTYPGYFYRSGLTWYYDSQCLQTYQSMTCSYPYSYVYSCTTESSYNYKKSNCDYYASSEYLKSLAESCYAGLDKCRSDINEYQSKLNEYNTCVANKEY